MLPLFPDTFGIGVTRRCFMAALASSFGVSGAASAMEYPFDRQSGPFRLSVPFPDIVGQVTPKTGVPTGIAFGDSIQKLIAAGVLDPDKFRASEGNLPDWVDRLLASPSDDPILISEDTSPYLVNLLWPLGLSNRAAFNENSPVNTLSMPSFASTGGWTMGREQNGYVYFNQADVINMTDQQQATVFDVATNTFRPCCDNSTLFQDCNHGSALLGLLELAASQGATMEGLYGLALTANSFWFPDYYAKIALYFWHFHNKSWSDVPPQLILGSDFSSLTGWQKNIDDRLQRANITLPGESKGQQAC